MQGKYWKQIAMTTLSVVLMAGVLGNGCPADPNINGNNGDNGDNGDNGNNGALPFTIVKTDINVRHDAAIKAGTDLIAFGTDTTTGVSFIIPSTSPTAGTAVPDSAKYDSSAFAVGNDKIFLAGSAAGTLAFQVSVYDATAGAITKTFPTTDIRLGTIPVSGDDVGNIQADGNYCVVMCDQGTVTDGKIVKVIDAGNNPPTVTSFTTNPAASHFQVDQVAVDAATKTVVAVANGTFFIYDIDNPTAAPVQVAAPDGISDVQIDIYGNYIIALDDQSYPEVFLVDISAQAIKNLTGPMAALNVAIGDGVFAFFADATADDRSGGSQRAAVGATPGPANTKVALDQYIDGSTANNGLVGFAGSMDIVPDGSLVFLSNSYLQFSTGTATFLVAPDPDGSDTYGTPAWNVHCSATLVTFKTASDRTQNTTTKVGYIILP